MEVAKRPPRLCLARPEREALYLLALGQMGEIKDMVAALAEGEPREAERIGARFSEARRLTAALYWDEDGELEIDMPLSELRDILLWMRDGGAADLRLVDSSESFEHLCLLLVVCERVIARCETQLAGSP